MSGRRVGFIRNGVYYRVDDDAVTPAKDRGEYFKGVKPSDLARLDNRQLYTAAVRLHEGLQGSGTGTPTENAHAAEALQECYAERRRRRASIH